MLKYLIVINQSLSCEDETATDDEQMLKVLYFYPYDITNIEKLTKINMLESLISFTHKFSKESIQSVVMKNITWGFYQCESSIWMIFGIENLSYNNNSSNSSNITTNETRNKLLYDHPSNDRAILLMIQYMYKMYFTLHGSITMYLHGIYPVYHTANVNTENEMKIETEMKGIDLIKHVQSLHKNIRKINIRLTQETRDYHSIINYQEQTNNHNNHNHIINNKHAVFDDDHSDDDDKDNINQSMYTLYT